MFETININLDFKDLKMIKTSLSSKIEYLESKKFVREVNEEIDEYKQLLNKINNNLKGTSKNRLKLHIILKT